jgi:hypothetical protein
VVVAVVKAAQATDTSPGPPIKHLSAGEGARDSVLLLLAGGALALSVILAAVVAGVWLRGRQPRQADLDDK